MKIHFTFFCRQLFHSSFYPHLTETLKDKLTHCKLIFKDLALTLKWHKLNFFKLWYVSNICQYTRRNCRKVCHSRIVLHSHNVNRCCSCIDHRPTHRTQTVVSWDRQSQTSPGPWGLSILGLTEWQGLLEWETC